MLFYRQAWLETKYEHLIVVSASNPSSNTADEQPGSSSDPELSWIVSERVSTTCDDHFEVQNGER